MTAFTTIVLTKRNGQWVMTTDHESLGATVSHAERVHKERGGIAVGATDLLGRNWKLTQPIALAANEGAP